jgi:hypothetical protein
MNSFAINLPLDPTSLLKKFFLPKKKVINNERTRKISTHTLILNNHMTLPSQPLHLLLEVSFFCLTVVELSSKILLSQFFNFLLVLLDSLLPAAFDTK